MIKLQQPNCSEPTEKQMHIRQLITCILAKLSPPVHEIVQSTLVLVFWVTLLLFLRFGNPSAELIAASMPYPMQESTPFLYGCSASMHVTLNLYCS